MENDMSETAEYNPPKVWAWNKPSGGAFASIKVTAFRSVGDS